MGQGGEVFVLDMGNPVKIIDLANELIKRSGFESGKDIKIEHIGARPGEKLFEEILTAEEGTAATQNQKIFVAKISSINIGGLDQLAGEFMGFVDKSDKKSIINTLGKLIPSYKPSNHVLNNKFK